MNIKFFLIGFFWFFLAGVYASGNLAPNPKFEGWDNRKLPSWNISKENFSMVKFENSTAYFKIPADYQFIMSSIVIELNQQEPTPLSYGVDFKGECFPASWKHGLLLNNVIYQDGTTAKISDTHFIFRAASKDWSCEKHYWMPPKSIKNLNMRFIFQGTQEANFALRNLFLKEVPNAENSPDFQMNYHGAVTNLVSNHGFEIVYFSEPKNWVPYFTKHPRNKGLLNSIDYSLDSKIKRSGKYSLLLTNSKNSLAGMENIIYSVIDFTREFTFSGWLKAEKATGMNFLEVVFYRAWAPIGLGAASPENMIRYYNMAEEVGRLRTPITSGTHDWKKLSVSGKAPAGANLVRFRIASFNNSGRIWVDDLEFDGLGNAPAEILISQAGFPTDGLKEAYVRARNPAKEAIFSIKKEGKAVISGKLKPLGKDYLDCFDYLASFSKITDEGKYTFEAILDGTIVKTPEWEISRDFYYKLTELSRAFMFMMRCGCEVPGYHKACHLDDGQIRSKPDLNASGEVIGHVNVSGGWHDAGDYDKFPVSAMMPIVAMARLSKYYKSESLLGEAAWGADWFKRIIANKGGIYSQIKRCNRSGGVIIDQIAPDAETDNIPGNADDRTAVGPPNRTDITTAFALAEYAANEPDKAKAKAAIDRTLIGRKEFLSSEKMAHPQAAMMFAPALAKLDLLLWKLTGDQDYRESSKKTMLMLLDKLEANVKTGNWNALMGGHYYSWGCLLTPMDFAEEYPDDQLVPRIKRIIAQCLEKNPLFAEPTHYGTTNCLLCLSRYSTTSNLMPAAVMAQAAKIFRNRKYLERAERLFYHITGVNDTGTSLIGGIGWKTQAAWCACNGLPGFTNGTVIKGAVQKGVAFGNGSVKASNASLANGTQDNNLDHPAGYPFVVIAYDYPLFGMQGAQEVFERNNGEMMMVIWYIVTAQDILKKGK